jgi:hypothetical protein
VQTTAKRIAAKSSLSVAAVSLLLQHCNKIDCKSFAAAVLYKNEYTFN